MSPKNKQFHLGIFTGLPVDNKIWVSAKKNLNVIFFATLSAISKIHRSIQ